MPDDA